MPAFKLSGNSSHADSEQDPSSGAPPAPSSVPLYLALLPLNTAATVGENLVAALPNDSPFKAFAEALEHRARQIRLFRENCWASYPPFDILNDTGSANRLNHLDAPLASVDRERRPPTKLSAPVSENLANYAAGYKLYDIIIRQARLDIGVCSERDVPAHTPFDGGWVGAKNPFFKHIADTSSVVDKMFHVAASLEQLTQQTHCSEGLPCAGLDVATVRIAGDIMALSDSKRALTVVRNFSFVVFCINIMSKGFPYMPELPESIPPCDPLWSDQVRDAIAYVYAQAGGARPLRQALQLAVGLTPFVLLAPLNIVKQSICQEETCINTNLAGNDQPDGVRCLERDLWGVLFDVAAGRAAIVPALLKLAKAWRDGSVKDRVLSSQRDRYYYKRDCVVPYSNTMSPFHINVQGPVPPSWPRASDFGRYSLSKRTQPPNSVRSLDPLPNTAELPLTTNGLAAQPPRHAPDNQPSHNKAKDTLQIGGGGWSDVANSNEPLSTPTRGNSEQAPDGTPMAEDETLRSPESRHPLGDRPTFSPVPDGCTGEAVGSVLRHSCSQEQQTIMRDAEDSDMVGVVTHEGRGVFQHQSLPPIALTRGEGQESYAGEEEEIFQEQLTLTGFNASGELGGGLVDGLDLMGSVPPPPSSPLTVTPSTVPGGDMGQGVAEAGVPKAFALVDSDGEDEVLSDGPVLTDDSSEKSESGSEGDGQDETEAEGKSDGVAAKDIKQEPKKKKNSWRRRANGAKKRAPPKESLNNGGSANSNDKVRDAVEQKFEDPEPIDFEGFMKKKKAERIRIVKAVKIPAVIEISDSEECSAIPRLDLGEIVPKHLETELVKVCGPDGRTHMFPLSVHHPSYSSSLHRLFQASNARDPNAPSLVQFYSDAEARSLTASQFQQIFPKQAIVICPGESQASSDPGFSARTLEERVEHLDYETEIQDQSVLVADGEYSDWVRVGNLRDIYDSTIGARGQGKCLNGLSFPDPYAGLEAGIHASDALALRRTRGESGCPRTFDSSDVAFRLVATEGAFHLPHIDNCGDATWLVVVTGEKVWFFLEPKDPLKISSNALWTARDLDLSNLDLAEWHIQAVLLTPGTKMYMPPTMAHAAYTRRHCICVGGHFLPSGSLARVVIGLIHTFFQGKVVTNTLFPASFPHRMNALACYFYRVFCLSEMSPSDEGHYPDVSTHSGLMDLVLFSCAIELQNTICTLSYKTTEDRHLIQMMNSHSAGNRKGRLEALRRWDINALPHEARMGNILARGRIQLVLTSVFKRTVIVDEAGAQQDPWSYIFYPTLARCMAGIIDYMERARAFDRDSESDGGESDAVLDMGEISLFSRNIAAVSSRFPNSRLDALVRRIGGSAAATNPILPMAEFVIQKVAPLPPRETAEKHDEETLLKLGLTACDALYLPARERFLKTPTPPNPTRTASGVKRTASLPLVDKAQNSNSAKRRKRG